jgi:hypothetical protein
LGASKTYLDPDKVIPVLDIIVGNTCVLIDRDPGNIERRKVYGRAGEYRVPTHGLEYRTLSNFWLRSYQTMSFVLALTRFGVSIANSPEAREKLMSLVNMEDIQDAINNNDAKLAQKNFNKIKKFISGRFDNGYSGPLSGNHLAQFEFFVEKGLDHWFKEDIMQHWLHHNYRERYGWENFLMFTVAPQMPVPKTVKEQVITKGTAVLASIGNQF